jgi:Asp-tRNA(Asn)/Glu-tRNA(Gln) amidotransferase A subunit family amidase
MQPFFTIAEANRQIAAKQVSPVELARACLERIEHLDPHLHSFLLVTGERALTDARASEARVLNGSRKGPLDGIPIAHKDIYKTAGIRTTAHSRLLIDDVPSEDATVVARLAHAGMVLTGKLANSEFAFGHSTDLPWPQPNYPWYTDHTTGGSSSGTGAAVAAGLIPAGTGTEAMGSICGPSAWCGITGVKPTYGRGYLNNRLEQDRRFGIFPLAFTVDHAGPMARTAEDCALLLQAMAGQDPADPTSSDQEVPNFCAGLGQGVRDMHIGVVRQFFERDNPASPAVRKGIEEALAWFRAEGAIVRDVSMSPLTTYSAALLSFS